MGDTVGGLKRQGLERELTKKSTSIGTVMKKSISKKSTLQSMSIIIYDSASTATTGIPGTWEAGATWPQTGLLTLTQ